MDAKDVLGIFRLKMGSVRAVLKGLGLIVVLMPRKNALSAVKIALIVGLPMG